MVILDTNIIIDHLRRIDKQNSYLEHIVEIKSKKALSLSIISIQELYEGKSIAEKENEHYLLSTISPLTILPYTYEVAQLAGEIARNSKQKIELADAAIAATAIVNNAELYTLNTKDFLDIPELPFYTLVK